MVLIEMYIRTVAHNMQYAWSIVDNRCINGETNTYMDSYESLIEVEVRQNELIYGHGRVPN